MTPRFGGLSVLDCDSEPYTSHVVVLEGGNPVYRVSKRATATPADNNSSGGVFEIYPIGPGEHVLHARLDGQRSDEWVVINLDQLGAECLTVRLEIGTFGSSDEQGDLSMWRPTNLFERDDSTPTSGDPACPRRTDF